jgi:hypothetical protein
MTDTCSSDGDGYQLGHMVRPSLVTTASLVEIALDGNPGDAEANP